MFRFANILIRLTMKKIVLLLAIFCSAVGISVAQTESKADVDLPEITFKSTELDYGTLNKDADGTRHFEFTNTGKQPLVLTNVVASCGCTVVEWAKEPIKPGEKGSITVKYNTAIVGPFHKTIRVFSNSKVSPVLLTIKGEIKPLPENSDQKSE